ncbi:MAG: hypothetical protein AAF196_13415 [Planctomycetota bacterium]
MRDNGGNTAEEKSSEPLARRRQAATLIIGQPEPASAALRLQEAVLLDRIGGRVGLLAVDPAAERREKEGAGRGRRSRGMMRALLGRRNLL